MYELREGDFEEFFSVPFFCYPTDTPYVSPFCSDLRRMLSRGSNPLFVGHGDFTFYTLRRGSHPVGRIVAHVHHDSNRHHGLRRGYFGFFDCADDEDAARLLLGAAEAWGRQQGCAEIAGNFNLTAMQQIGVVTDGYQHLPYTDQLYAPPHVPRLLTACGYEPFFPMSTFEVDLANVDPAVLLGPKQRDLLREPDLRWLRFSRRRLGVLMRDARIVLNDGFADNPMFVPLTDDEFRFQGRDMMWIIDPHLSVIVYQGDDPIGVLVCIPDLNPFIRATRSRLGWATPLAYLRHRLVRPRAVIIFFAVRRSLHGRGLNGVMLVKVIKALRARGYRKLGVTWIADVNGASLRQVEKIGGRRLHRLHLFRKKLVAA